MNRFCLAFASVIITATAAYGGTIKIHETADGFPADGTLGILPTGVGGVAGFVVLMESHNADTPEERIVPENWSDVLEIIVAADGATSVQLTSPDCGTILDQEHTCDNMGGFSKAFIDRVVNGNSAYQPECGSKPEAKLFCLQVAGNPDPTGPTIYTYPGGTIQIFSNQEDDLVSPNATGGFIPRNPPTPGVPEPSTWLLFGSSLAAIVISKRQILRRVA